VSKKQLDETIELVVLCINNTGIEDRFDLNVEYCAHYVKELYTMLEVEDRFGKKSVYDKQRFKIVDE